jgi:hypothetical protein
VRAGGGAADRTSRSSCSCATLPYDRANRSNTSRTWSGGFLEVYAERYVGENVEYTIRVCGLHQEDALGTDVALISWATARRLAAELLNCADTLDAVG